MKARKNISGKLISIAVLVLVFLNLCACGSSNQVVSKRLIQKRKYTSGWFVKSPKPQKQSRKEEFRAEVIPIEIAEVGMVKNPPITLAINNANILDQKNEVPQLKPFVPSVFRKKRETNKVEAAVHGRSNITFLETSREPIKADKSITTHQENSNRSVQSSRKYKDDIDPWLLTAILVASLLLAALIIAIIIDSVALLNILLIIGGIIAVCLFCYLVYDTISGFGGYRESFFDIMFR